MVMVPIRMVAKKENRYMRLMNRVIRPGVRTKVLMLSATPVNNRFYDLRNQLALAYEGNPEELFPKVRICKIVIIASIMTFIGIPSVSFSGSGESTVSAVRTRSFSW